MSEPIVFITSFEVHDGRVADFKDAAVRSMRFLEVSGPQLFAGTYLDEERGLANGIQVHRDSESILSAWQIADPNIREVMQYVTTTQVEIFGRPSEAVMEGMRRLAGGATPLVVKPRLAGFTRLHDG